MVILTVMKKMIKNYCKIRKQVITYNHRTKEKTTKAQKKAKKLLVITKSTKDESLRYKR